MSIHSHRIQSAQVTFWQKSQYVHDNKFICLQIRKFMSSTFAILLILTKILSHWRANGRQGVLKGQNLRGTGS